MGRWVEGMFVCSGGSTLPPTNPPKPDNIILSVLCLSTYHGEYMGAETAPARSNSGCRS